jgi:glycosyltransferase involved in cell wall biosynthesis
MKKRKVVYIVSDIDKSLAFEWTTQYLKPHIDLFFILIGKKKTVLSGYLQNAFVPYEVIADDDYKSNLQRWLQIRSIIRRERPDAVHTHLWRATMLGLTAAWFCRVKKRILTRHHATLHYVEYPSGRKWDVLCNSLATDVIAISENVKDIVVHRDGTPPHKVHVVHHGFDLSYFRDIDQFRVNAIRQKYKLTGYPVVGVISRYLKLKGIQYIIPAFKKLLIEYPEAHLVLANAHGDYANDIKGQLRELSGTSYTEILFEEDLAALYKVFDVFVHVPTDQHAEAFGQTYIEALAARVPSVFTQSGVAPEFIEDERNALVVDYKDDDAILLSMKRILENPELRSSLITNGEKSLLDKFPLEIMISKLVKIYNAS